MLLLLHWSSLKFNRFNSRLRSGAESTTAGSVFNKKKKKTSFHLLTRSARNYLKVNRKNNILITFLIHLHFLILHDSEDSHQFSLTWYLATNSLTHQQQLSLHYKFSLCWPVIDDLHCPNFVFETDKTFATHNVQWLKFDDEDFDSIFVVDLPTSPLPCSETINKTWPQRNKSTSRSASHIHLNCL